MAGAATAIVSLVSKRAAGLAGAIIAEDIYSLVDAVETASEQLDRPIYRTTLSELASGYVGEVTAKLDDALGDAEAASAVLLIDEADLLAHGLAGGSVPKAYAAVNWVTIRDRIDAAPSPVLLTLTPGAAEAARTLNWPLVIT